MQPRQSRLRVAIDATPLLGTRTGVGVFCQYSLGALAHREDLALSAFAVSWRRRGGIRSELPPGVRPVDRPMPARPLHRAWRRGGFPPIELFVGAQEVVHGTNFVVPPTRRAARVMTVHDLTAVRFPEMCDAYTQNFPSLVRRAIVEGAWVHTPSTFVAAEVVELLGASPERVRAVHHGVPPLDPPAPGAARLVEGPYVLALGTVEPRKDLPTLVRAFDRAAADLPGVRLVVAGAEGWRAEAFRAALASATHRERILRLGYVSARDRARLLREATVYAYPSLYEGFGLPPLEAMSVGVPVVTTTAGALPEVLGSAAEMVEPGDADAMAEALVRLTVDEVARSRAVEAGLGRVAGYSWEDAAAGLCSLYWDAWSDGGRR